MESDPRSELKSIGSSLAPLIPDTHARLALLKMLHLKARTATSLLLQRPSMARLALTRQQMGVSDGEKS
jgi:hypothetical protein